MRTLGLDIGTQSLKAIVADESGSVLGRASSSYGFQTPRAGWAEQSPIRWEEALIKVVPQALERAGLEAKDLDAIGIAAQLDGCIAIDVHGQAIGNCLIWMDRRATDSIPRPGSSASNKRTGLVADPGHLAAKACWLQKHMQLPPLVRFCQPTSYLVLALTGSLVTDPALASTTMVYDIHQGAYASDLLAEFGLQESMLASIEPPSQIAGTASTRLSRAIGLVDGTPVVVGTGDDFATLIGSGALAPETMIDIIGTAEVVGAVAQEPIIDDEGLVETHPLLDVFFLENPGWLSGGAMAWLRRMTPLASDQQIDSAASEIPLGSDGVAFLPALNGAMTPVWNANARGAFSGLSIHHGPGHLARAVMESSVLAMLDVHNRLAELGLSPKEVRLVGGGARSALWAQMRADALGMPVLRVDEPECCALGASLLAIAGVGDSSVQQLAEGWPHETQTLEPEQGVTAKWQAMHIRYRQLFDALRPTWS